MNFFRRLIVGILACSIGLHAGQAYAQEKSKTGFYAPAGTFASGGYYSWYRYNAAFKGWHLAQDFKKNYGDTVYATTDGDVVESSMTVGSFGGDTKPGGAVVIRHSAKEGANTIVFYALYGHLGNILVAKGAHVGAGKPIATIGHYASTDTNGKPIDIPHLHFGIHPYSTASNPFAGYTKDSNNAMGWVDPLKFIGNHSSVEIARIPPAPSPGTSPSVPTSPSGTDVIEAERFGWTAIAGGRRTKAAWSVLSQGGTLWAMHVGYDNTTMFLGAINPLDGSGPNWDILPGQTNSTPTLAGEAGGAKRYYCHQGLDGYIYWMTEDLNSHTRTDWSWMNYARSSHADSIVAFNGKFYPILKGGTNDNAMLVNCWIPSVGWWSNWWELPEGRTNDRPGIGPFFTDLYAIHRGESGQIYLKNLTGNTPWFGLPGTRTASPPSMAEFRGELYIIHRTDSNGIKVGAVKPDRSITSWVDVGGQTLLQPGLVVHNQHLYATRVSPSGYMYLRDITDIAPQ